MPLSPPAERDLMHKRAITLQGYARADGQFDVDAHMVDTKAFAFSNTDRGTVEPGIPLHEMWVRMTVSEAMVITGCEAVTEHGPFNVCGGGAATMSRLVGLTIRPGFLRAANERLGGIQGCTHLREMLQQIATVAMQTLWPVRSRREAEALEAARARGEMSDGPSNQDGSSRLVNSCHAYASAGPVVARRWPHLATAPADAASPN